MIVIHNFKEAHQLYQQGHIPFRLLQEQALVLIGSCPQPGRYINEALDISVSDIEWILQQPSALEDYGGYLGGDVHICQTEADLKEIVGMDMEFARTHAKPIWRGACLSPNLPWQIGSRGARHPIRKIWRDWQSCWA